jgi:Meiotically up-regulated gene 113
MLMQKATRKRRFSHLHIQSHKAILQDRLTMIVPGIPSTGVFNSSSAIVSAKSKIDFYIPDFVWERDLTFDYKETRCIDVFEFLDMYSFPTGSLPERILFFNGIFFRQYVKSAFFNKETEKIYCPYNISNRVALETIFKTSVLAAIEHESFVPPIPQTVWTYFIFDPATNCIKIGRSKNPHERLKNLQTANSTSLRIFSMIPSKQMSEKEAHSKFGKYRIDGEWFEFVGELKKFLCSNAGKQYRC